MKSTTFIHTQGALAVFEEINTHKHTALHSFYDITLKSSHAILRVATAVICGNDFLVAYVATGQRLTVHLSIIPFLYRMLSCYICLDTRFLTITQT